MVALKITKVGNSVGVVLPKEVLARLRVKQGDQLYLVEAPDGYHVTPYNESLVKQLEIAEDVIREDRDVLKALAK